MIMYSSYVPHERTVLKKVANCLNFDEVIIPQKKVVDILYELINISKGEIQHCLENSERIFVLSKMNYSDSDFSFKFYMTNQPSHDILKHVMFSLVRQRNEQAQPTWFIDAGDSKDRMDFINQWYYRQGHPPKVGDIILVSETFSIYLIRSVEKTHYNVSPVNKQVTLTDREPSNSVNGFRWEISQAIFNRKLDPSKMIIDIEDQPFGYVVLDHLLTYDL